METFKFMPDKENKYQISDYGRAISLNYNGTKLVKDLSYITDKDGYKIVRLYYKNKAKCEKVHRLVAITFIPNPLNKPQVNHKDGNKSNNHISNLEWSTAKENVNHSFKSLNRQSSNKGLFGYNNHCSKETHQYSKDLVFIKSYGSQKEAARELSINHQTINACINGRQKTSGGFIFTNKKI